MKRQPHVFVVDPEPVIASSLAAMLRLGGFSASTFTNPLEALASALIETPDLLVSDVMMSELSGVELATQIKALCPTCKVLLFSGEAKNVDFLYDAERVSENFHILPKPVFPSDVLKAINEQGKSN